MFNPCESVAKTSRPSSLKSETEAEVQGALILELAAVGVVAVVDSQRANGELVAQADADGVADVAKVW